MQTPAADEEVRGEEREQINKTSKALNNGKYGDSKRQRQLCIQQGC